MNDSRFKYLVDNIKMHENDLFLEKYKDFWHENTFKGSIYDSKYNDMIQPKS